MAAYIRDEGGQVGGIGGPGDRVGGDAPNGGIRVRKQRPGGREQRRVGPSTSPAHAWSPAATTRPSRSARNAGERPGPAKAAPSAAAARSRQSPLTRQRAAACANAAESARARATSAARRSAKTPFPPAARIERLHRLLAAELAERLGRLHLDAGQRIGEHEGEPGREPGASAGSV